MQWHFGPFRLDLINAYLWRAEERVPLRPKTLALFAYLVAHAGQLVTKETLLDAVWPETAVGDGVLKTSLGELRKALGETAKAPQWIATVPRHGYRFLASVTPVAPPAAGAYPTTPALPLVSASPPPVAPAARLLVGRAAVLEDLQAVLAQASRGLARPQLWKPVSPTSLCLKHSRLRHCSSLSSKTCTGALTRRWTW